TDALGADWDELNMVANRYGAATEGASITLGTPATVVKYANGVDASGCLSWKVAAGTYDFAFDPSAMTLTLVNAGDNPNPNPNPDPNPTPDPTPGEEHYIYFDGTSFTQPMVYAWIDDDNRVSAAWGGDNMVKKDGKWYWEVPEGKDVPKMVIIHEGDNKIGAGDLTYVDKATYHQDGTYTLSGGDDPNPPTPPTPASGDMFILGNLSVGHWNPSKGVAMTAEGSVYSAKDVVLEKPATDDKAFFTFVTKLGTSATDWDAVNASDRYGASTKDEAITAGSTVTVVKYPVNVSASSAYSWAIAPGTYDITFDTSSMKMTVVNAGNDPTPVKPVVTASPASGTTFTESLSVTLTVSPAADIYYTLDGSAATISSTKYSAPISISETTTISTLAVTADGAENAQKFSYTKRSNDDPNPPTPSGNNLITNYYKVNPNGQCGTFKTVNMTGHPATNAFSNWGPEDLIAQGVARDVCQAFKGVHERPIVDSYAVYAAYDNDNLYLGIQFVYAIWDLGGEGKQPGESKPYNMDGHMCLAFDLDPNKSFDGYISGAGPVWNDQAKGAKFANGVDAVIMCSTKPGVGTPGLFLATPDGHASYDAEYCKALPAGFWGHIDGLHPSIDHVWGQADFSYDPELLKGNEGFVDLRSEIDDDAHTFYEFKLPLSSLGITADQIRNQGIGFMYLDKYGTSPVGGTPYDPSFFDNVNGSYSQDVSSSQEKEDEDVITYAPARIGKMGITTGVELPVVDEAVMDVDPIYFTLQGVRVENPSNGLYIVVRGNKVTKEF
ncbi:MAG: chitobiase/beta-hexosaminidase C-terminal domain-containing protein, partial [Muribaculaceae bacterium]|nr:chitobiase/beta-hexosaminidase C-terminal domain-containing protein [Muribaculaceae bacterium]